MLSNAYSKSANYKLWTSKYSEPDLGHSRWSLHKPCPHLYVFFYLYVKTCNVTYCVCITVLYFSFMQVVLPINLGFSWSWSHPGPDEPWSGRFWLCLGHFALFCSACNNKWKYLFHDMNHSFFMPHSCNRCVTSPLSSKGKGRYRVEQQVTTTTANNCNNRWLVTLPQRHTCTPSDIPPTAPTTHTNKHSGESHAGSLPNDIHPLPSPLF